jgi:hypothetical protein
MRSRRRRIQVVASQFNLDVIPPAYRMDVVNATDEALLEPFFRMSYLDRLLVSHKGLRVFTELPQTTIVRFLRVSDSVVSECRRQAEAAQRDARSTFWTSDDDSRV